MRVMLVGVLAGSMLAGVDAAAGAGPLRQAGAVAVAVAAEPAAVATAAAGPATAVAVAAAGPATAVAVAVTAAGSVTGVAPRGAFGWPLTGFPTVLRRFDPPDHRYGPGHRGVDLGGRGEQPVLAAGAGVVVFAGMVGGKPVVSVDHPNGLRTTYEPVVATVSPGQRVARGETIGTLRAGHDGCLAAACLHWGVRRGDEYLDPLWLLAHGRVRLLPADP